MTENAECFWLILENGALQSVADALACKHAAPRFQTHVTYLNQSDILHAQLQHKLTNIKLLEHFAAALAPKRLSLSFTDAAHTVPQEFYLSCFLRARDGADVKTLQELAQPYFSPGKLWMPHLSLMYGKRLPAGALEESEARVRELKNGQDYFTSRIKSIALVECDLNDIESWKIVKEIALL